MEAIQSALVPGKFPLFGVEAKARRSDAQSSAAKLLATRKAKGFLRRSVNQLYLRKNAESNCIRRKPS